MNKKEFKILLLFALFPIIAFSQGLAIHQIDSLAQKTLQTFNVPGMAVAVVKDGKVALCKGYGEASLIAHTKVDEHTLFGIASNTKAFTAAALGILVDEKKIDWDTPVTKIIPEFKMYDDWVTKAFTIRDLLTHRSGLGLGAGDLMIWPDSSKVTKTQLIHNLRFLKPVSSFRTKFDYDNLLYVVAGEVVARVSKQSYEDFITNRIFKPLGMTSTVASFARLKDNVNVIKGHVPYQGKMLTVPINTDEKVNAAGGILSNATDMGKWIVAMLNGGRYGKGLENRLFSQAVATELWSLQTPIHNGDPKSFAGYGLGWFVANANGHQHVWHTGGLGGMVSFVSLLPEQNLGVIVLTNQQSGGAFYAMANNIKDAYLGNKRQDWIKKYKDRQLAQETEAKQVVDKTWKAINEVQQQHKASLNPTTYTGNYKDVWFGEVTISKSSNGLFFQSANSPKLRGQMSFYKDSTYVVKWQDRTLDADAFVSFNLDKNGKATGFKMQAISPLTDFSFDFHDLDFKR